MILLFSYDGDRSTNRLIEWLKFINCPFKRINIENEDFRNLKMETSKKGINFFLKLSNGEIIDFTTVKFIYNRGKKFNLPNVENKSNLPNDLFNKSIMSEFENFTNYFYKKFNKMSVGCFQMDNHSKLIQLEMAHLSGLKIPEAIISDNLNQISGFFNKKRFITKAIQENIAYREKTEFYIQRVQQINYAEMPSSFYPSFFQTEIQREFEVRTYYLDGEFFSIKIFPFSQKIDIRDSFLNCMYEKFNLPKDVEERLIKMMNKLELISGSIDLIKSKNGKYYFLEVNPNGQYDWVSQYGGYYLDKKIAYFLKSKL